MKVSLQELMDKMGIGYILGPYESCPWGHYDAEHGIHCNAEARMGMDSDEIEAEVQIVYDEPPEGKNALDQAFYIKAAPTAGGGQWTVTTLLLHGQPLEEDIYNWEEKSCRFFKAVVEELQAGALPDIEDLIDMIFHSNERFYDQYGGGGGKSPKVKGDLSGIQKKGM